MNKELLHNWEKKTADRQKTYKQYLQKADKNKVLKQLPELHEEAFSKIDCLQCANCCKNFSPRFKTPDIKRISKYLKMRESDFIEKYLKVDEDGDFVVLASSKTKNILSMVKIDGREMDGPNLGAPIYSTPVAANGTIYVASNTHLWAFGATSKGASDEVPKVQIEK